MPPPPSIFCIGKVEDLKHFKFSLLLCPSQNPTEGEITSKPKLVLKNMLKNLGSEKTSTEEECILHRTIQKVLRSSDQDSSPQPLDGMKWFFPGSYKRLFKSFFTGSNGFSKGSSLDRRGSSKRFLARSRFLKRFFARSNRSLKLQNIINALLK